MPGWPNSKTLTVITELRQGAYSRNLDVRVGGTQQLLNLRDLFGDRSVQFGLKSRSAPG
jgi:hypothetical protein